MASICTLFAITIMVSMISLSHGGSCVVRKNTDYYLSLSVDDLFNAVTNGNKIGHCFINENPAACDLYMICRYRGKSASHGCPLNTEGAGTGCVKAPDFPKGEDKCYYEEGYDLPQEVIASFCTEKGKENAVAMVKWALQEGHCGIPSCVEPIVESCSFNSPGCNCECNFNVGFGGPGLGNGGFS